MSNNTGYIKLFRKFREWEWYSDPVVKNVFLELLLTASYEEKEWQGIRIMPGQVITSLSSLSKSTGYSVQQVRTALNKLENSKQINKQATNKHSIISVENWRVYQGSCDQEQQANNTPSNSKSTTYKKKRSIYNNIYSASEHMEHIQEPASKREIDDMFERLWALYPNKKGKSRVSERTKRQIYDIGEDHMKRAIERYIAGLKIDTWRKPQNGSTYFNGGYVDYLDQNYQEPQATQQQPEPKSGKSNVYTPEPPKYEKFERESWEDIVPDAMPDDMRRKFKRMR